MQVRHSWGDGLEAHQELGEAVSGLLVEKAQEEAGAAGGGSQETAEDEEGMAEGREGWRGVLEDLVLESGQEIEEQAVEVQDGLGAPERAQTEAVGGELELELLDAVLAVGSAVVEEPDLFRGRERLVTTAWTV